MVEHQYNKKVYAKGLVWIIVAVVIVAMVDQTSATCTGTDANCNTTDTVGKQTYYYYFGPPTSGSRCPPSGGYNDCPSLCNGPPPASNGPACTSCCNDCCPIYKNGGE